MKKKIKFLIITKYLQEIHDCSGGMEAHVNDLINGLKKENIDITIISSKHPEGKSHEKKDNINYFYVKSRITRNPFSRYKYMKDVKEKLREIQKKNKFDVIHVQSDFGLNYFNKSIKHCPVITTIHGTATEEFLGSIKSKFYLLPIWLGVFPFYFRTESKMVKNSNKIISVSETIRKKLIQQQKVAEDKLKTIYNGIDLKEFRVLNEKKIKNLRAKFAKKNERILLSVGNIIKQKGYHLIINALPSLLKKDPKIKLVVVGSGDYLNELKSLTKKLRLEKKVFFVGKVERKELVEYYNIADFFVFPTLRGEGLPYVLIEAMACGLVPITCLNGGIKDICNKKNSVLIKNPKNKKELVKKIQKILRNKPKAEKLKKKCLQDVKNKFDKKNMIIENIKTYKEVLAAK